MSIMFQLFSAEDLKALSEQQLVDLASAMRNASSISPDSSLRMAAGSNLSSHWEDARRDLLQTPPAIDLDEITKALRDRARQVFEQLLERSPNQPQEPLLDPSQQDILPQLIDQQDLNDLKDHPKEHRIFEIAMSCELSYFNSYSFLRAIKQHAYQQFGDYLKPSFTLSQKPKGPDSRYSPYRRDHPLYQ
jgi:hypothetical protein